MMLDRASVRVLGALMEKEMTTPDAYPLSLNAVVAASNQRSSRDPVMELSEEDARTALDRLEAQEMVTRARDGGRVARYEHRVRTVLNLRRDETAVLCLLLLRGAQTPGELRSRSDRMFSFDDLGSVQATLDRLAGRETPLAVALARAPGSREVRWVHLLGEAPDQQMLTTRDTRDGDSRPASPSTDELEAALNRIDDLERRVLELERRLMDVK